MARNWGRDELVVAFNLYCKLPFGQRLHAKNPRVSELAGLLRRTPGSVAMKLVNFASLDPTYRRRGVTGLVNTSKGDRQVWDDFNGNWADLAAESERAYRALLGKPAGPAEQVAFEDAGPEAAATEAEGRVKVRLCQAFFRQAVLASYGERCCVCGLPEASLLVASHVVPWAARAELRANPRNGLCLCSLHDRAFDRGLMTLDPGLTVRLSPRLEAHLPDDVVEKVFVAYRGGPIRPPEKFLPEEEFLAYHRTVVFVSA